MFGCSLVCLQDISDGGMSVILRLGELERCVLWQAAVAGACCACYVCCGLDHAQCRLAALPSRVAGLLVRALLVKREATLSSNCPRIGLPDPCPSPLQMSGSWSTKPRRQRRRRLLPLPLLPQLTGRPAQPATTKWQKRGRAAAALQLAAVQPPPLLARLGLLTLPELALLAARTRRRRRRLQRSWPVTSCCTLRTPPARLARWVGSSAVLCGRQACHGLRARTAAAMKCIGQPPPAV